MINLMLGPPGGGKSYESVVYHVLASIQAGRKVITNLPIFVEEFAKIEPAARTLLELRTVSKVEGARVFSVVDDYVDDWRHPEHNYGPLIVIDECHKPLRRVAAGEQITIGERAHIRAIEEYYAEHRHSGADILLITQSYGKVNKAICDLVQVTYRVKKATMLGREERYVRKVQDGLRGEVISTVERQYEPKFYKLYRSHTASQASIIEAGTLDVRPAFLKWKRAGNIVMAIGFVWLAFSGLSFFLSDDEPKQVEAQTASARTKEHALPTERRPQPAPQSLPAVARTPAPELPEPKQQTGQPKVGGPFDGLQVHLLGSLTRKSGARTYLFALSQNGLIVARLDARQVAMSGYTVESVSDCAARLTYGETSFWARCDVPSVRMGSGPSST